MSVASASEFYATSLATLIMDTPLWSYYAFAAVLFVAAFSQDSASGNFTITITLEKGLVNNRENGWKLWCSSSLGSCTKAERDQLTTGHDTRSVPAARAAMEAIETCYAFCMEQVLLSAFGYGEVRMQTFAPVG